AIACGTNRAALPINPSPKAQSKKSFMVVLRAVPSTDRPATQIVSRGLFPRVVLAIRRKDIQHFAVGEGRRLMLHTSGYEKTVAPLYFERAAWMLKADVAADDVNHLFMRVAVPCTHPSFRHRVADQHHGGAVGHHLPFQTGLGRGHCLVVRGEDFNGCRHTNSFVDRTAARTAEKPGLRAVRGCSVV